MNCSDCRDVVLDIARGVAHAEEAGARAHMSTCEACSRYLQQQRALTAGLRALAAEGGDVPSSAMEQRLMGARDARSAVSARSAQLVASRAACDRWLKVAAAIVLASSAMAAWRWSHRTPPQVPTVSSVTHGPQAPGPAVANRMPADTREGPAQATAAAQTAADNTPADSRTASPVFARPAATTTRPRIVQATGFVALPAAAMLPPFERGEIMRVRVRLVTLADLGFAVQADANNNTPIDADLLVGQDGQPRAIRLVTDTQASRSRR